MTGTSLQRMRVTGCQAHGREKPLFRAPRPDFAHATVNGRFTVVYLLRNTITNLTTQDEQIDAFANAAAHLQAGGCFVVENYVPSCAVYRQARPPASSR